tara:strand:+ start:4460 stop:7465 length:3006 start_codon:yes stop_codon:yes gene_type:complete
LYLKQQYLQLSEILKVKNKILNSEEDITGKLLLPYLNDLGLELSEISLEDSFKIRLGKSLHKTGRSDILCKKYEKNLFVIEVKNKSVKIEQNDIDQGISYARLLDQIAPFTIITNGNITRIFDTVSKKELTGCSISQNSSFWKNGYTLSNQDEIRIRIEALSKFVSLSPENLNAFCEIQVNNRMGTIIGSANSPHAKFVKELHVQNKKLKHSFEQFNNSENSVFGLVGDAGVGKSNAICSLSLQSIGDNFVFFYNGTLLDKSPIELLAQDLNIVFSGKTESETVLKKLNDLGSFSNKNILIFIDGVDECVYFDITPELSEMALAIRNLEKIKICFSCKSTFYSELLEIKGTKTHLYEELIKHHDIIPSLNGNPGFLLSDFSKDEMNDIIPIYRKVFGFKGEISDFLLKELQNGFFLRIFSEVYSNKSVPEKLDDKDLIKKYLNQSLGKTELGVESGLRILSKIGKVFSDYRFTELEIFKGEGIAGESLYDKLNLSLEEKLPRDLFDRNLLIQSNNKETFNISFYYSKIRDYIICYHTHKLHRLNNEQFYEVLNILYENRLRQSALSFYCNTGISSNHEMILRKFKREKALNYVNQYESYLNDNFKRFKELFDPKTEGEIGIIMPKDPIVGDGYALFPMKPELSDKILFENLAFSKSYHDDPLIQKGVQTLYGSNKSLLVSDQTVELKKNIFEQLKKILEKTKLNGYNSDILLREKVAIILYCNFKKLGYEYDAKDFYLPRFDFVYPIDLKDLEKRMYAIAATKYFRKEGKNTDEIKALLENSYLNIEEIPGLKYELSSQLRDLWNTVQILLKKGQRQILKHYLPTPDISLESAKELYDSKKDSSNTRMLQFSDLKARSYLIEFFKLLEKCYSEFVEYYFPTYKNDFPFYSNMPHEYFIFMRNNEIRDWGFLAYKSSENKKIKVNFKNWDTNSKKLPKEKGIKSYKVFSIDQTLHVSDRFKLPRGTISSDEVEEYCVFKYWIYHLLNKDFKEIFEEFTGSKY